VTHAGRFGPGDRTAAPPRGVLPRAWSWWVDGARDGVTNMAADQALLETVRPGHGTWRWYGWERPTVSFGRNARLAGRIDADTVAQAALAAVRRPTGGRALLHWRELTYSVTMPLDETLPWRAAYAAVNQLLLLMLHRLHVPAVLAGGGAPVAPEGPVCFEEPASGEITVAGRKLVGSAVWRQGGAYLQHGSILLHDDQSLLRALTPHAPPPPPAASLAHWCPTRSDGDLTHDAHAALQGLLTEAAGPDGDMAPFVPDAAFDRAQARQRAHFADSAWLWRR